MYKIENLVTNQNRSLYEAVAAKLDIKLNDQHSDDGYWGAVIEGGSIGRIQWFETDHPVECFSHELLHLKFDLAGKSKPGFRVDVTRSMAREQENITRKVHAFVRYAYNQLSHRKLYPEFIAMGFKPDLFTADDSDGALDQVESSILELRQTRKFGGVLSVLEWGLPFLSSIDLATQCGRSRQLLNALKQVMGAPAAVRISAFIRDFDNDGDPNMPIYLARLMADIPNAQISFGYSAEELVFWNPAQD